MYLTIFVIIIKYVTVANLYSNKHIVEYFMHFSISTVISIVNLSMIIQLIEAILSQYKREDNPHSLQINRERITFIIYIKSYL